MLSATPKNQGAKGIGASAVVSVDRTLTLADLGITKDLSSRAQSIATIPQAHDNVITVADAESEHNAWWIFIVNSWPTHRLALGNSFALVTQW